MIKLELRTALGNCPKCWIKFIEMLDQETEVAIDNCGYTVGTINGYLKPYGATYVEMDEPLARRGHLLFNSEEDIVVFKLRF